MITPAYFREMADYNKWQNANVIANLDAMRDEERRKDRGLFFQSLHRTFDHIAMVDDYFLAVLQDRTLTPFAPDRVLFADWLALKLGRARLDAEIGTLARAIAPGWGEEIIESFSAKQQRTRRVPRGFYVMQMFNHQTHHRSQLTTGLHQMGLSYGTTDLPFRPGIGF